MTAPGGGAAAVPAGASAFEAAPPPNSAGVSASAGTASAGTASVGNASVGNASVGELVGQVTRDLSTLMRQELELAKVEIKTEATKAGKGAGMLGGAGFAGYMVLLFLSMAAWWALVNVMDAGWAALIVAVLWAVIGAVLFTAGRSELRTVHPKPERTVETVSQVPSALKGQ